MPEQKIHTVSMIPLSSTVQRSQVSGKILNNHKWFSHFAHQLHIDMLPFFPSPLLLHSLLVLCVDADPSPNQQLHYSLPLGRGWSSSSVLGGDEECRLRTHKTISFSRLFITLISPLTGWLADKLHHPYASLFPTSFICSPPLLFCLSLPLSYCILPLHFLSLSLSLLLSLLTSGVSRVSGCWNTAVWELMNFFTRGMSPSSTAIISWWPRYSSARGSGSWSFERWRGRERGEREGARERERKRKEIS